VLVGTDVLVGAEVIVDTGDSVTMKVEVGCGVRLEVAVGKLGTMVMPGVLVGTLGTHSN
jgi:hypothetical protein